MTVFSKFVIDWLINPTTM